MNIIASLKDYTEQDRLHFIVEYNHTLGYEIIETEQELLAVAPCQEQQEEIAKLERNAQIDEKIQKLQLMALPHVINNNEASVNVYKQIIDGLNESRL